MVFPSSDVPYNPKKINRQGQYQPYYGYTIISKVDTQFAKVTEEIEKFIKTSSLKNSYSALPADTYHTSIYTIYSNGNKLIPPIERWFIETCRTIPKRGWLPDEALMQQNSKAMRILKNEVSEPLQIKSATLTIGGTTLSLTVKLEEESLRRIENARKELVDIYEHQNLSLHPISEKLHITIAYAYGKKKSIDEGVRNRLRQLVRPLNQATLMPPTIYLFKSMTQYQLFQSKDDTNGQETERKSKWEMFWEGAKKLYRCTKAKFLKN